jgi:CheY-like chemotaxis protein
MVRTITSVRRTGTIAAALKEMPMTRIGTILVADDNVVNRMTLSYQLRADGHSVLTASDGRETLAALRREPVDLVLLDLIMPKMDGIEVLQRIKADARLRDIPVIVISGVDEIDDIVRCIEAGAEDYLHKPFNSVLLRARLQASLDKKFLRALELAYRSDVDQLTAAATDLEAGRFQPAILAHVVERADALGHLARVFVRMATQVAEREKQLRKQIDDSRYVFISYASADRKRVYPIAESLEAAGIRVWIDRNEIAGGANYGPFIVQGIRDSASVLVACSAASMQSRNVKQEIQLAWKYQRPYVPLLLEQTVFPDDVTYWLEGWQWIEVMDRPNAEWFPELLRAINNLGLDVSSTVSNSA